MYLLTYYEICPINFEDVQYYYNEDKQLERINEVRDDAKSIVEM